MDALTELAWRNALQARGKEWITHELRTRPGRPDDTLLDVVFEPPHPTRSFCEQWCAEQDNKIFHLSWQSIGAIAALVLFIICFWQAVGSWNDRALTVERDAYVPLQVAPDRTGGSGGSDFSPSLPKPYSSSDNSSSFGGVSTSSSSASSSSSTSTTPSSLCSYITYDTTRCPPVQH
jgi:hypothetical protein